MLYFGRFFFVFFFYRENVWLRMASRKVRTYESLKFQRPQTKASILPEAGRHHSLLHALGPLSVFVYSRHGEETFWQPVTHAKPGRKATQLKRKTYVMIFFFKSIYCSCTGGITETTWHVWHVFLLNITNNFRWSSIRRQSRTQASRHSCDSQPSIHVSHSARLNTLTWSLQNTENSHITIIITY